MMINEILGVATVMLTGIAAGLMVGQWLLHGRFINWFFEAGPAETILFSFFILRGAT